MPSEHEVQKERGRQGSRQQYVNCCVSSWEVSQDTFSVYLNKLQGFYDLYRGIYQGKFHAFRNNISIPLLFSVCQSDIARKASMIVGGYPVISFVPGGPEDTAIARKREALVNQQLEDAKTYEKAVRFLLTADLYGTAPYRWYWDEASSAIHFRADFGEGESEFFGEATTFNGPQWEPIDPRDFFPCPGYSRVDEMPWVVHRTFMDMEDIQVLAERGYFDKEGAYDAGFSPPPTVHADIIQRRDPAQGGATEGPMFTKFQKPVEILEWWGRVPRSMSVDNESMCVITVANRKHLLRARPIPFWGKKLPFGAYSPMPDPKYYHAPGKIEIGEKLQYASNRIANQKMDALDLFIDPVFLYNRRSGLDVRNLRMRPGRWFGADGPVDDSMIRPLVPDLRGLQNAYGELEQQWRWMQQGTGSIEDIVQGMGGSDRQTAREFMGRSEAVNNRLLLEARLAECQWLEPLARNFVDLDRQFLPFPQQVRMIGANAVLDPITLQPVAQDTGYVTVNDMLPDYDARALGATRQLGKAAMQQNMIAAMQAVSANPIAIQAVNWFAFFRQFFKAFDFENVDELMNTQNVVQQVVQQALAQGPEGQSMGTPGLVPMQGKSNGSSKQQPQGEAAAPGDLMTQLAGMLGG